MGNSKAVPYTAYQCLTCGKLNGTEFGADDCCKIYHCADCGIETKKYHLVCNSCQEKRTYENATKMTIEEYYKKYPANMVFDGADYHSSVEDMLEDFQNEEKEFPNYCFGTSKIDVELNSDAILEGLLEDTDCEALEFNSNGEKEFYEFSKQWNEKYSVHYFIENSGVVILIPEDMKKEYSE